MSTPSTTALVTGSTSGIGKAAALSLARAGHDLILHGRDAFRGGNLAAEITQTTRVNARFIAADLSKSDDVRRLAEQAGAVDVLVNNGGVSWFGPTADLDDDTFDKMLAINIRAAHQLVGALAPGMVSRGKGVIINIDSMAGRVGLAGGAAYSATKAAQSAMTRAWAAEFAGGGVRVNAVAPGPVFSDGANHDLIEQLGKTTLLERGASVEEIAGVITFLASDVASYVTGATIAVDGGRTAV